MGDQLGSPDAAYFFRVFSTAGSNPTVLIAVKKVQQIKYMILLCTTASSSWFGVQFCLLLAHFDAAPSSTYPPTACLLSGLIPICAFYVPTATLRLLLPGSTVSTERENTLSTERERIWRRVQCVYVAEYRKGKAKLMMMASAGLAKAPEYRKGKDLAEGRMCLRSRVPKGKSEIPHQRFFQFKPRRSDETLSRWLLRPRKEAG